MATTEEELSTIRKENDEKREKIREAEQKASMLKLLVENDSTKASLLKESSNLDAELAKVQETVKALEEASGVSAESLDLPKPPVKRAVAVAPEVSKKSADESASNTSDK